MVESEHSKHHEDLADALTVTQILCIVALSLGLLAVMLAGAALAVAL